MSGNVINRNDGANFPTVYSSDSQPFFCCGTLLTISKFGGTLLTISKFGGTLLTISKFGGTHIEII